MTIHNLCFICIHVQACVSVFGLNATERFGSVTSPQSFLCEGIASQMWFDRVLMTKSKLLNVQFCYVINRCSPYHEIPVSLDITQSSL